MAFELIHFSKANQGYRGPAEKCTWDFTVNLPDQLGASWKAKQLVDAHIEELAKQDAVLLELRLYEDKLSGTFTTAYRVEVTSSASPLWWNVIIVGVLTILALVTVYWIIRAVENISKYSPATMPILGLAALAAATAVVVYLIRRPT